MITQEEIPYTREEVKAMVKTIEQLRREKKELIEKAWQWLRYNRWKYEDSREGSQIMEQHFRKAMEE